VQHLNHHCCQVGALRAVALALHPIAEVGIGYKSRAEHNNNGTNALSARREDVRNHFGHQLALRRKAASDKLLEGFEVRGYGSAN
jgi:hypothetical protein